MAEDRTLIQSIATIAEHLKSVAPAKKVSHFEYITARKRKVQLKRKVLMSGVELRLRQLTDNQVELLNRLKPGTYNSGRWTVIERNADGLEGGLIEIWVRNKTQEDRGQLAIEAPSLDVLLQKIVDEQEARSKQAA